MPFYGGMLHPFVVPAHIMALVSLGLFAAQHAAKEAAGPVALALLISMVAGVSLSGVLGDPDTDLPLLAASTAVALMVSWARPMRPAAVVGAAAVIGLLIGLGSAAEGVGGSKRWIFLAGTCVGVLVGTSWILIVAGNAKRPWQKIAVRVNQLLDCCQRRHRACAQLVGATKASPCLACGRRAARAGRSRTLKRQARAAHHISRLVAVAAHHPAVMTLNARRRADCWSA